MVPKKTGMMILASFLIVFTAGCDRYTQHNVLTFFFTGVPPLEGGETSGAAPAVPENLENALNLTAFVHGPKAAGQCFQCHETAESLQFREQDTTPLRSFGGSQNTGITGRLSTPLKDL